MRATAVIEDAGTTSKRTMEFPRRCSSLLLLPLLLLLFLTSPGHGGLRGNRSEHYLVLHPFYSGSHVLTLHAVAEELVNRGHRVTTVRFGDQHNFSLKPLGLSYKEILLHMDNSNGSVPFLTRESEAKFEMPMQLLWTDGLALSTLLALPGNPWQMVEHYCDFLLGHRELRATLEDAGPTVALVDLIYNECGLALAHHLGVPTVGYWAFSFSCGEAEMTTAATPPSHVPMFLSEQTHEMSFWGRLANFLNKIFAHTLMEYHTHVCDRAIRRHLPETTPSAKELLGDLSGVLINTHSLLDYPRLQPETFVNVGGMQIPEESSRLPKQLEEWVEGAPAEGGVVLMTMGFIFNPAAVPRERVDALLEAFSRVRDTRFIVKFETAVDEVPDNVLVLPFVPQRDILAHPKTRLFITHCGMHGVMEAIYYGVPMVGMPVFIDQSDVRVRLEEKGIGVGISKMASADVIQEAILKVREDKRILSNVRRLSSLMRDRRHHPMEDALWLLEYVGRTRGAEHLKLASRRLSLVQYFSLDCAAFVLACIWIAQRLIRAGIACLAGRRRAGGQGRKSKEE